MNPLLVSSPLEFGFPDFDAVREEHFAEAFEVAMAEQRAEVAAITALPGRPTFDDTVVALERSGATLRRVSAVFFVLVGSLSTPGIRETEALVAPLLAAVLEGDEAIEVVRAINGATDGRKAAPGTIRGDLSLSNRENLVHGSDSEESATREIGIWFPRL